MAWRRLGGNPSGGGWLKKGREREAGRRAPRRAPPLYFSLPGGKKVRREGDDKWGHGVRRGKKKGICWAAVGGEELGWEKEFGPRSLKDFLHFIHSQNDSR